MLLDQLDRFRSRLAVGVNEIVAMRYEVRVAPVRLTTSQEVRLQRLARRAVVRDKALFLPVPPSDPAAALADFIRSMWPPEPD